VSSIFGNSLTGEQVRDISTLNLAFIGDAVFTLFIRDYLVKRHDAKAGELTKKCAKYCCASYQSMLYEKLKPQLTDEEMEIMKRVRNCKTNQKAKNATLADYKRATAFEGLIGWLYLREERERLEEVLKFSIKEIKT